MLLRSVTQHVKNQNWFAVVIDFLIVVVGVFVGIQVSNWNEARLFNQAEIKLFQELKREVAGSYATNERWVENYTHVHDAGKRSLEVLSSAEVCKADCWRTLVGFMDSSQHQALRVQRTIYDRMRSLGLPRSEKVFNALEAYMAQADATLASFNTMPDYRTMVRELIPFEKQKYYWTECYFNRDGFEYYKPFCTHDAPDEEIAEVVAAIKAHPTIKGKLTRWTAEIAVLIQALITLNQAAESVISAIDEELSNEQQGL